MYAANGNASDQAGRQRRGGGEGGGGRVGGRAPALPGPDGCRRLVIDKKKKAHFPPCALRAFAYDLRCITAFIKHPFRCIAWQLSSSSSSSLNREIVLFMCVRSCARGLMNEA